MHKYAKRFTEFCKKKFNLKQSINYNIYQSLPVCLLHCVYSLRDNYSHTIKIVQNYTDKYLGPNPHAAGKTISQFLNDIDAIGIHAFANDVLQSHNKLGGKAKIPKEEIVYQIAKFLRSLKIETIADFNNFASTDKDLLDVVLYGVKGFKTAGVNYLYMLTGNTSLCKPDVHIHQAIKDACKHDISDQDCQVLFTDTVALLKSQDPSLQALTVRQLDGIIWKAYSQK